MKNIELSDAFQNTKKLTQLIQQYYKMKQGVDVQVQITGDNLIIKGPKKSNDVPMRVFKTGVDMAKSQGSGDNTLYGFLAKRL